MRERSNSIANALGLCLPCTNPIMIISKFTIYVMDLCIPHHFMDKNIFYFPTESALFENINFRFDISSDQINLIHYFPAAPWCAVSNGIVFEEAWFTDSPMAIIKINLGVKHKEWFLFQPLDVRSLEDKIWPARSSSPEQMYRSIAVINNRHSEEMFQLECPVNSLRLSDAYIRQ